MPGRKRVTVGRKRQRRNDRTAHGVRNGYRSGLEKVTADRLTSKGIEFEFEERKVAFLQPSKKRRYTPDFILPNGIIIETKGRFLAADRQKHLWIAEQHPDLEIRFVFSNANAPIYKGAKTKNRDWADKYGFHWAHKEVPECWLSEPPMKERQEAVARMIKIKKRK